MDKPTIEDIAVRYRQAIQPDGEVVKYGTVDRGQLSALRRKRTADGQEAMKDFRRWYQETRGVSQTTVNVVGATIWNLLCDSGNNPIEIVRDKDLPLSSYTKIVHALRFFGLYLTTTNQPLAEQEFGRTLLNDLGKYKRIYSIQDKDKAPKVYKVIEVYSTEEYQRLLAGVEKYHQKYPGRLPWIRVVLPISLLTAIKPSEVSCIRYEDLEKAYKAWKAGDLSAGISIYQHGKRTRIIPIMLFPEEARKLLDWPIDWGMLCDLIAPNAKITRREQSATVNQTNTLAKIAMEALGGPLNNQKLRATVAVELYKKTNGDWITIQQILGVSRTRIEQAVIQQQIRNDQS